MGFALLLAVCSSCAPKAREPNAKADVPLMVLNVKLYDDGWKNVGSIRLFHNGTYLFHVANTSSPASIPDEYRGEVSTQLCSQLESLVASNVVTLVNGTPTFDYYPDDSHHSQPKPIEGLYRTVIGRHLIGNPTRP